MPRVDPGSWDNRPLSEPLVSTAYAPRKMARVVQYVLVKRAAMLAKPHALHVTDDGVARGVLIA